MRSPAPRRAAPRAALLAALAALIGAGCGAEPRRGTTAAGDAAPEAPAGGEAGPPPSGAPGTGVPHATFIQGIELAPDGSAALTRDAGGGWRLWTALDGSAQPQLVPARGARQGSLARAASGELTAALVDSAGGLHLFRTEAGRPVRIPLEPPAVPVHQVRALPGGGHVLALRGDHVIELYAATGERLAALEERGFRPASLLVGAAPDRFVALTVEPGSREHEVGVHRIELTGATPAGAAPQLRRAGAPLELTAPAALGPGQVSLAPDGRRLAFLAVEPSSTWRVQIVELDPAGGRRPASRTVELPFQAAEQVTAGFLDDDTLLAASSPVQTAWRVELSRGDELYPHQAPVSQFGGAMPSEVAGGVRLAGVGTWLYVDRAGHEPIYLGYDRFEALSGAISPDRRRVAWAAGGRGVYVRALDGGRGAHLPAAEAAAPVHRALFVDPEHLLVVDSAGGMRIVDWQTGAEQVALDAGGPVLDVEVDSDRRLLRVVRQHGQTWVYRLPAGGAPDGPFIVGDGSNRSGFLAAQPGSGRRSGAGPVLWTLDTQGRYRTYQLAELVAGLSRRSMLERGDTLQPPHPIAVDRHGGFYSFHAAGGGTALRRHAGRLAGEPIAEHPLPPGTSATVVPAPDGVHAALLRSDSTLSMVARDAEPVWSRSFVLRLHGASFSADGSLIAVAGHLGSAVLDTATGAPVDVTCGPWFGVRRTAPVDAFAPLQQGNLCEGDWAEE